MNTHRLYAIYFHDGRVKIGVTGQIERRMTYYRQEAVRNRISGFNWCAFKPFLDRSDAFMAERSMCMALRDYAIPGHREWFVMNASGFGVVVDACEDLRVRMACTEEDATEIPWLSVCGEVNCEAEAA